MRRRRAPLLQHEVRRVDAGLDQLRRRGKAAEGGEAADVNLRIEALGRVHGEGGKVGVEHTLVKGRRDRCYRLGRVPGSGRAGSAAPGKPRAEERLRAVFAPLCPG